MPRFTIRTWLSIAILALLVALLVSRSRGGPIVPTATATTNVVIEVNTEAKTGDNHEVTPTPKPKDGGNGTDPNTGGSDVTVTTGETESTVSVMVIGDTITPTIVAGGLNHDANLSTYTILWKNQGMDLSRVLQLAGFSYGQLNLDGQTHILYEGDNLAGVYLPNNDPLPAIDLSAPWPTGIMVLPDAEVSGVCAPVSGWPEWSGLVICTDVTHFTGWAVLLLDIQNRFVPLQ